MKFLLILAAIFAATSTHAYQNTTGFISELYVHENGAIALKLEEGFTSSALAECPSNNGYAGSRTADPILKSLLLAAYASKSPIKLGTSGCDGTWLSIRDVRGI